MALVVEDGTGLENAESYNSVSEITTYNMTHQISASTWGGLSEAEQERHARIATQYMEVMYAARWMGTPKRMTQKLDFPRYNVFDENGVLLSSASVPQVIKDAHAEIALRSAEGTSLIPDEATPGDIKREKLKVDVIEIDTEFLSGQSQIPKFNRVERLVEPLLLGRGSAFIERS